VKNRDSAARWEGLLWFGVLVLAATAQEHDADAESFFQAAHAASAAMWRDED